jgi:hypothetical protein
MKIFRVADSHSGLDFSICQGKSPSAVRPVFYHTLYYPESHLQEPRVTVEWTGSSRQT